MRRAYPWRFQKSPGRVDFHFRWVHCFFFSLFLCLGWSWCVMVWLLISGTCSSVWNKGGFRSYPCQGAQLNTFVIIGKICSRLAEQRRNEASSNKRERCTHGFCWKARPLSSFSRKYISWRLLTWKLNVIIEHAPNLLMNWILPYLCIFRTPLRPAQAKHVSEERNFNVSGTRKCNNRRSFAGVWIM